VDNGLPGGMYRNQFWIPYPDRDILLCLGIHGQMIYINRSAQLVAVKLSSWPLPQDAWKFFATVRAFDAIAAWAGAAGSGCTRGRAISVEQLSGDEPDWHVTGVLEIVDHRFVVRVLGIAGVTTRYSRVIIVSPAVRWRAMSSPSDVGAAGQ